MGLCECAARGVHWFVRTLLGLGGSRVARTQLLGGRNLSAVLLGVAVLGASSAVAAPVFVHSGNSDPTTEGWTKTGPLAGTVTEGPVTNDLGLGVDAWFVDDDSAVIGSVLDFSAFLTPSQAAEANSAGWNLSSRLRVAEISAPTGQPHSPRFTTAAP